MVIEFREVLSHSDVLIADHEEAWRCAGKVHVLTWATFTLIYWVGQKVSSGFSIASYGKTQANFLANPI